MNIVAVHQTFPPLQPHPNAGNFYVTQFSHSFDGFEAPDEVLSLNFNYDPGGGRVNQNTSALGLFIESNYNSGGAHYKEFQLRFTGKDDVEHRLWAWRINENNFTDWKLITETCTSVLRDPVTGSDYLFINPFGWEFTSESARAIGRSFGFSDDGTTVILNRKGDIGYFNFQNFQAVHLPGEAVIGMHYNEFKSDTYCRNLIVRGQITNPVFTEMQAQIEALTARVIKLEKQLTS